MNYVAKLPIVLSVMKFSSVVVKTAIVEETLGSSVCISVDSSVVSVLSSRPWVPGDGVCIDLQLLIYTYQ